VKGLEGTVISSDGALIEAPLPDAGQRVVRNQSRALVS
jgi:hypothetical protein